MDTIKNDIQKSRLKWFGHVTQRREEWINYANATHKNREKRPRGRPRTTWISQIGKDIEMRGKKYKKTDSGKIYTAGDFSVIVYPYLWKQLKKMMMVILCLYLKSLK